jgi:hypothetical protein
MFVRKRTIQNIVERLDNLENKTRTQQRTIDAIQRKCKHKHLGQTYYPYDWTPPFKECLDCGKRLYFGDLVK